MKYFSSSSNGVIALVCCTILSAQLLFFYIVYGCVVLSNTATIFDFTHQQLQENEFDLNQCAHYWNYSIVGVISATILYMTICSVSVSLVQCSRILQGGGVNSVEFAQPVQINIRKNVTAGLIIYGLPLLTMCLSTLLVWGTLIQVEIQVGELVVETALPTTAKLSCSIETSNTNTGAGNADISTLFTVTFWGGISIYGYTACTSMLLGTASWIDSPGPVQY